MTATFLRGFSLGFACGAGLVAALVARTLRLQKGGAQCSLTS